jgi:hypothetical protein
MTSSNQTSMFLKSVSARVFLLLHLLTLLSFTAAFGQTQTQTISGTIIDEASRNPLAGATVSLVGNNSIGTATDADGRFRLTGVPIGRHALRISYLGYEERVIPDIVVTAGKEVQLNLSLQENINELAEVKVSYSRSKDKTVTNNDMAMVSARSFNVEETKKYAGALGDPSRMAANFAGVVSGNDSRNDIVVRGNSPTGMLWQLEGLNIPNPNHFGTLISTGGPVSMLNNNNIDKSDFFTSGYPAQYGNALAGVFDIRLRNGNTHKREFVAQVGFNGFELGAEGPLSRNGKSSYLVNYRYSTLGVFQQLGIQFGTGSAVPIYQDVNYKFQTAVGKKGNLSLFGIAGTSNVDILGSDVDTAESNLYGDPYANFYTNYATTITGLSYAYQASEKTNLKLTLGYATTYEKFSADSISYENAGIVLPSDESKMTTGKASAIVTLVHKFNRKHSMQAGMMYDHTSFDIFNKDIIAGQTDRIWVDDQGSFGLAQAYVQWKYRLSNKLTAVAGVHGQYLTLNDKIAVEPRVNFRYALHAKHALSAGYGLNHQAQSIYTYFVQTGTPAGAIRTNRDLGFTRSNQFVLTYDWIATDHFRLKAEAYYQSLDNVPVESRPSSFSALNTGASFVPADEDSLVNEGTGTNYGIELTLERFFHKGYYFLVTTSLFDSKYAGSDGVERNTAFNTGYAANVLAGKEFRLGKKGNVLALNLKATSIGGRYFSPVDIEATQKSGRLKFDETRAYSEQQDPYFRVDVKLGYRKEFRKSTLEFSLDLQNVTNNKNVFSMSYDPRKKSIYYNYQQGFFPVPTLRYTF